jgi:hypothetical protein
MMAELILKEIKPEAGELGEHPAFVRDAFAHHHIEGRKAVRGDHQQFVAEFVDVPDFSTREKLNAGEIRFQQDAMFF